MQTLMFVGLGENIRKICHAKNVALPLELTPGTYKWKNPKDDNFSVVQIHSHI